MTDNSNTSRRDFLARSAKAAAVAGLLSGASCSLAQSKLNIAAGPKPKRIGPNDKIRIGCVGVGSRMKQLLRTLVGHKDEITFVALADTQQGNLDAVKKMIQENAGQTPETYLGDEVYKTKLLGRDDIDAVFLATPCYLHGRMYLDCFAAGKHFYGEKPLCTEAYEANALVEAQKKNPGVVGQIGFQRRASERYKVGIQKMSEGVIGKVYRGAAAWNGGKGPIGFPKDGSRVWLGRVKYSGDWMLEQACHTWDVLSWAIGELPVAVSGCGNRGLYKHLDPDRDVTDYYLANLEYGNGLLIDYSHCWTKLAHDERRLNGVYEYFVGLEGGMALNEGLIFPPNKNQKVTKLGLPGVSNATSIQAFFDAVRKGGRAVSTVETAKMATLTGLLVRKAVYENRRVQMKEIL